MRVSRDQMLMEVAQAVAKRGTCSRKQVGVVVAREGRVLVTGYNGSPAGMPHCGHEILTGEDLLDRGGRWKDLRIQGWDGVYYITQQGDQLTSTNQLETCPAAVHAEANAIAFAAKYGMSLDGAEMFTTYSPCLTCAKLIINAGIIRVSMCEEYHDRSGIVLLQQANVETQILW